MSRNGHHLLHEALELPVDERAELAADLRESLDSAEQGVNAAWAAEIEQRVAAARSGELEGTEWRTVLDRVDKDVLDR